MKIWSLNIIYKEILSQHDLYDKTMTNNYRLLTRLLIFTIITYYNILIYTVK